MLKAVYSQQVSTLQNLTKVAKGEQLAGTCSSGHTFYRDGIKVARLYNYVSASSQVEVDGKLYVIKRRNRVVLFTQHYTLLERDGPTLATAKETQFIVGSNSRFSYPAESPSSLLTLKTKSWGSHPRQYLLYDGSDLVGSIEHDSDFGAEIDLPLRIPVAMQIFIYKIAFIMWQRGVR